MVSRVCDVYVRLELLVANVDRKQEILLWPVHNVGVNGVARQSG